MSEVLLHSDGEVNVGKLLPVPSENVNDSGYLPLHQFDDGKIIQPVPALSKPSEYLLVDCVGSLPRSKAGHLYLLKVMCLSTQ